MRAIVHILWWGKVNKSLATKPGNLLPGILCVLQIKNNRSEVNSYGTNQVN